MSLSSVTANAGSTAALTVSLTAGSVAPAGLQWTLSYPAAQISAVSATIGAASSAAGKSIACASSTGLLTCLLYGLNTTGINSGVVADVQVTLATNASTTPITLINPEGVDSTGSGIALTANNGLISIAPVISSLACAPASLSPPAKSTCTATISQAAAAGGYTLGLTSNNSLLAVPASVTVAPGATTASFSATASASVANNQSATISATLGASSQTAVLSLVAPILVSSVSCNPTGVMPGVPTTCSVTLSQPAPSTLAVSLNSNSPLLSIPASLNIPAGSATGATTARAASISSNSQAVVTASLGPSSQNATVSLWPNPVLSSLACNPTRIVVGSTANCTVSLSQAAGNLSIGVTSSNAALAVPSAVAIAQGVSTATFNVTAASAASGWIVLTTSYDGSSKALALAITPPQAVSSLNCNPAIVASGDNTNCTVTLVQAAPAGGATVTLSSGNAAITIPCSVTVPQGATTATFTATSAGILPEAVWLTGSLSGSSASTMVTVSALQIQGDPSELSGWSNGAVVTPKAAPSGFVGDLVVQENGVVKFEPVNGQNGVSFLNCCSNVNTAHYKFTGPELGNIFSTNQGQVSFYLKSSYTFAQRQTVAAGMRYAFDIQDDVSTLHHWFYFVTEYVSSHLTFSYLLGGSTHFYYVPIGTEDTLFGNGVTLQVTITWGGGISKLYLNGSLVQSVPYTSFAAAWSNNSVFDLGATEYYTFGGYNSSDDLISGFTVGVPNEP